VLTSILITLNKGLLKMTLPNTTLVITNTKINHHLKYGKHEIYYVHKSPNKDSIKRKYIHTNGTHFNIDNLLSQLNENDQKIDLVISIFKANTIHFPKNLSKIKCPKIAIIGDTFHTMYPLSSPINYLKRENFEHILTSTQPAHLHFFYEAGIKHSALTPRPMLEFKSVINKKSGVTYIGKKWKASHIRKSRMLQFLEKELPKNNIPFHYHNRLPYLEWLKTLSQSKMIVMSSLNGQFTPQIYIALSAGTLCFIDEISSQTFLYQFFKPDKHIITWSNFDDLLEKIIYYYNHPKKANDIAKAGQLQVLNNFVTTKSMPHVISDFVFENKIDPRFLAINDKRCQDKRIESPNYFDARVRLYENIQELHRIHESLSLISFTRKNLKPISDLADLPRLKITNVCFSDSLKNKADLYFESVGVKHQVKTILYDFKELPYYNIGILEEQISFIDFSFLVNCISKYLKKSSLLFVFGRLTQKELIVLKKEGFKPYKFKKNFIKKMSRKMCFGFWKYGKYPFPYLTIKPAMETVLNLNVFVRGWQSKFPFSSLY